MLLCDLLEGRRLEETTAVIVPSNREADAVSAAFKAQDIEHFKISGSDIFRQNILKAAKAYLSVLKDDFRSASGPARLSAQLEEEPLPQEDPRLPCRRISQARASCLRPHALQHA